MRVVQLSDHPGALVRQARDRRLAADRREKSRFEEAAARHVTRVQQARAARDQARADRRWLAWLRAALAARREQRREPVPPGPARRISDQEEIAAAGVAGEQLVEAGLARTFDDDWTLLRGYRNRRGEIDHLLLGPGGLVAIEGKYRNATVHCDGDDWRYDKFDKYGNLVQQGQLVDKGGRSPSVQLTQPVRALEEFLRSRRHPVQIQRVVLLTHPRSQIGNCRNLTVHLGTSTDKVAALLTGSPPTLTAGELSELERLIVADHKSHHTRR